MKISRRTSLEIDAYDSLATLLDGQFRSRSQQIPR
jgi:hypothetical protein